MAVLQLVQSKNGKPDSEKAKGDRRGSILEIFIFPYKSLSYIHVTEKPRKE